MTETNQAANGKVFISYSRKDKPFVQKLNDALDKAGVQAWVDWEGIELASDWMATISTAIQGNDAFLFIISPDSLQSQVCADELELGLKLNKKLIPILFREPDKSSTMHEKLASTNWVYLRDQDNFDETIPRLIQSINTDLGWVGEHTRLLEQAMEWSEKSRNNSFLLNGAELEEAERWVAQASGHANRQILPLQAEYINVSRKVANRRQRMLLAGVSLALVVSIVLSLFAWIARNDARTAQAAAQTSEALAIQGRNEAATARAIAETNAKIAKENEKIAEARKIEADAKTNLAIANRSAAQSQIYQTRSGELDTSTLLAIDSYLRVPSFQAEDLIRTNASKMAIPLKQMSQDGSIWNIEWSPDYQYFVTANSHDPLDLQAVNAACVWRASDGEKLYCVKHDDDVNDAIFTRDGIFLVTASADKTVRFWEATSGKPVDGKTLRFDGAVNDLDASDSVVAIAREDNFLTLYYLNSPDLKPINVEESGSVYGVKFSPNGNILAIAMVDGNVKFWQAASNFFYNGPKHPNSNYVALAFSPDSNWLVSGGGDSLARLTKRDGTVQYAVPHGDWVEDIAFGPDPSWYVTVSDDNKVRVLETATGAERLRMSHTDFVQKVKVSSDGLWIASTGYDRVVRIWDSVSGSEMMEFPLEANGSAISFNEDATRIVAADENGNISMWDISALATRQSYIEFPEYVHEARFTSNGESLIVNSDDYHIWTIPADSLDQLKDGNKARIIFTAPTLTYNISISPDSKWVAAVEYDSLTPQRNLGRLISLDGAAQHPLAHGSQVTGVAFDKESKYALTAGTNGRISFWDVQSGKENESLQLDNQKPVNALAVSPTDTLAAAGLRGSIVIWDYASSKPLFELAQAGDVESLVFSNDGKWLASGSTDGIIILWSVEDRSVTQNGEPLHMDGKPLALSFSPDEEWLAAGGSSGFAYLWSTTTNEEVSRIPHNDPVTSVSFSPDGSQLFTVSRKVVKIWNASLIRLVPNKDLIDFACSHMVSNFSQETWTSLFGDEVYRPLCPNLPTPELLGHTAD